MEQSHTFIIVSEDRAKIRHQPVKRRIPAARTKPKKKQSATRKPAENEAYRTPVSSKEDIGEESDVEEVPRSYGVSKFPENDRKFRSVRSPDLKRLPLRLYRETAAKKESIEDVFPAAGNLSVPYFVKTYRSRQSEVAHVLNYYLQVAGPTAMWRPQLVDGNHEIFKQSFFEISMEKPIIFEAVVAISQAHLDLSQRPGSLPSTAVLQHRGKVLRMLQSSLMSSPGLKVQDTDLMAAFCMLVLDIMYADWTSVKANMQGFRHLAKLRGGIDNLGWSGWFRTCFAWAELRWAGHIARICSTRKIDAPLERPSYPVHPFNPATCLSIARLPEGLREAALERQFSNEVIAFLEQVQLWTMVPDMTCSEAWTRQPLASFARGRDDYLRSLRISVQGANTLSKYSLKPSERLLCIGVIAYIVSADGSIDDGRQPRGLEDHMVGVKTLCTEVFVCDYLLWAGLAIAASTDSAMSPLSNHWVLLDRLLELDTRNEYRHWRDARLILRKYFWNPFIEARWEACWEIAIARKSSRRR